MKYKATFSTPDSLVKYNEDGVVELHGKCEFSPDELAIIATISECMVRLRSGKLVAYNFNPLSFKDKSELYKCEWLESGNLKVHGPTQRQYRYVETKENALNEHRTFTCKQALIAVLPKTRKNLSERSEA